MVERENLYWQEILDEGKGNWRYFAVSHPIREKISVDYWCFYSSSQRAKRLNIEVEQTGDELGSAWYDEQGFLSRVNLYPLTAGYQRYLEELSRDGLLKSAGQKGNFNKAIKRVEELKDLNITSSLEIEPQRDENSFYVTGVLNPLTEEREELGTVESGEMFLWDGYFYRILSGEDKLTVEVRSPLEGKPLRKRLVFPWKIDYDQVFALFTQDEFDYKQIPKLIPVEVEFPFLI